MRPGTPWLNSEMSRYNHEQKRNIERYGMTYVDLDQKIPKTLEYYFDGVHYTDKGSRKVADEVYPYVADQVRKIVLDSEQH